MIAPNFTRPGSAASHIVVIVMAVTSAIILFLFDLVWSGLTDLVYG